MSNLFGTHGELLDEAGREVFDSTKLSAYADCEYLGKLQYEEHLAPQEPAVALVFGSAFHKAVEVWTQQRIMQPPCIDTTAVANAEAAFVEIWEHELPLEVREMLEFSGDKRSVGNFKRLFAGYRKKFPLEMYEAVLACEQSFTLLLGTTPAGREVGWSGVIDRIVRWQDGIYYVDIKTSSYQLDDKFFDKFKLSGQMRGYTWAGQQLVGEEFAGALVQGVHVQAPLKTKTRAADELVQCESIPFVQSQLEEWRINTLHKIDSIHRAREIGYWERNYASRCSAFGGGCEMKRICWAPPEDQENRRQLHFKERVWNPLMKDAVVE